MFWRIKVAVYVAILGFGIAAGWMTNGWRLEARIASIKASHAQAYSDAQKAARARENALQAQADAQRKKKDAEIARINTRLAAALDGLHNRPSRLPESSRTCGGATGTELSKPDAEFLAREAARADKAVENLNHCIAQYNSLR